MQQEGFSGGYGIKRASLVLAIIFGLAVVLFGYSGNGVEKIKETPYEKPPIEIEVTFMNHLYPNRTKNSVL